MRYSTRKGDPTSSQVEPRLLLLSDRRVDLAARVVLQDGAEPVELTQLEASFLEYLADRPGETVDRELLLREVWGYAASVQSRAIDKSVHRLRTKIELDPSDPRHIIGVRGAGYRLEGARLLRPRLGLGAAAELLHQQAKQAGVEQARLDADPGERERIARLLHGHAEPIRLVAPRMAFQGAGELEAQLVQAIGDLDAPPERWLLALRACVDEEWSALDPRDREVLSRLAGFVGAFSSEDALAVQGERSRAWSLEAIERAVGQQLIWVEPGADGGRRMRLAPAVRARALQELARRGERERVILAGCTRTVAAAEVLARGLGRGDVARAQASLRACVPDLEAIIALTRAWDPGLAARAALVYAAGLGRWRPARLLEWVDELMPAPQDAHAGLRPALLMCRAEALANLGRPAEAVKVSAEVLELTQDPVLRATALLQLSSGEYWAGHPVESSLQHLEGALAALETLNEPRLEASIWVGLSAQLLRIGEEERAVAYIRRSVSRFRALNDPEQLARTLQHLVNALYNLARFEEALEVSEEVLREGRAVEGSYFEMRTWLSRFCCLWDLGRVEEAADCAERARLLAAASGRQQPMVLAHSCCGYAAYELGLSDQARFHFRAARRIAVETGQRILGDQAGLDLGQEAHLRGALAEAKSLYLPYVEVGSRAAPLVRRWWGLCLTLLLHVEEGDLDALRARADELAGSLTGDRAPRHAHTFDTLALAREVLDAPDPGAVRAARLLRYADGLRLEFGHEPRHLAQIARRAAARL